MDIYGQYSILKKITVFLAMVSLIFFAIMIYLGWENMYFYRSGHETIGRIIGFERIYTAKRGAAFYPIVQFKDKQGHIYQASSNISTRYTRLYELGEKYKVIYDPTFPNRIRANTLFGLWGEFIVVGAMTFFNIILYFIFDYYSFLTNIKIDQMEKRVREGE